MLVYQGSKLADVGVEENFVRAKVLRGVFKLRSWMKSTTVLCRNPTRSLKEVGRIWDGRDENEVLALSYQLSLLAIHRLQQLSILVDVRPIPQER